MDGVNWNRRTVTINGIFELETGNGTPNAINDGTGTINSALGFLDEYIVPALARRGGSDEGAGLPFALRCGNLNNSGTVRPGGPNAPGPFKMDGNFNAILSIVIPGLDPGI